MSEVIVVENKKRLTKILETINPALRMWERWEAMMHVIACILSIPVETDRAIRERRRDTFNHYMEILNNEEAVSEFFDVLIETIEENPCEDVLGELYMSLRLGDHWKGQYFTPSNVAELMASITMDKEIIERKKSDGEQFSIHDSCCGAGVMLLAGAKVLKENGVNYQTEALYVGQDIDRIASLMCFIQLSLNGCIGYICIANSLTNPVVHDENGKIIVQPGQEFWFTPMWQISKSIQGKKRKRTA